MPTGKLKFKFNQQKAIESIIYIATKISDPTFLRISKLLYFADKTSLESYGRFISGDTYYAMQYGPVPSKSYKLMRDAPKTTSPDFIAEHERNIKCCRLPKLDELSESDIECLNTSIALWGSAPLWKLLQDSHDAAYKIVWESRGTKSSVEIPIESIIGLLEDSDTLLKFVKAQVEQDI